MLSSNTIYHSASAAFVKMSSKTFVLALALCCLVFYKIGFFSDGKNGIRLVNLPGSIISYPYFVYRQSFIGVSPGSGAPMSQNITGNDYTKVSTANYLSSLFFFTLERGIALMILFFG